MTKEIFLADYKVTDYLIDRVALEFELADSSTTVKATSNVRSNSNHDCSLLLYGENLNLQSIYIDGKAFNDYKEIDQGIELYNLPKQFSLEINTQIDPLSNTGFSGLYKSGDAFCSQCESEGFRRITYYLDRPDVLAIFSTKITAEKALYPSLLSNGNLTAHGDLDNGRHWVLWEDPFPKPAYLFALVAGAFDCLKDTFITKSGRKVALELFVDKGNLDKTAHAMQSLKHAMKWDENRFKLEYDLDIYMIVAVDFFNMGAMENKGLNIFNAKYVLANANTATDIDFHGIEAVIGHEYFHNWTGNRITCRDWFQLSLKEGLTVFRDQEFSSDLGSRSINRINNVKKLWTHQFAEDAGPMSHPVRPASYIEINNFYTATIYEKGAEVIRMIHTLLGEIKFQKGIALYIERHDGQAVTCDDFVLAMSDANDFDFTLFKRWYSESGTPLVVVTDHFDALTNKYQLTFTQSNAPTSDQKSKKVLHIPVDIELLNAQGNALDLGNSETNKVLSLTQTKHTFVFDNVTEKPVPCLFRNFSAPVEFKYKYSDRQLVHLISFASDDFSRWNAAQILFNTYLIKNVDNFQRGVEFSLPSSFIPAFANVLDNKLADPALTAIMFSFISEFGAMQLLDKVDVEALHQARKFIFQVIADELKTRFIDAYQDNQVVGEYVPCEADMAKRSMAATALFFIAKSDRTLATKLVLMQVASVNNMTDHMAALSAASCADLDCFMQVMSEFDDKWFENGLVMDKWFALQATRPSVDIINNIKALFNHRSFNFSNPNRVRSLLGSFTQVNSYYFHAIDGSGYMFLTDQLIKLNQQNPQLAANLITPLLQFKRLDDDRQQLIKEQLNRLLVLDNLSPDLYEKVSKALAY
ncbi:MAG: aminopeptidase N [Psychromonas sp.]|nr:aminopeptidase N [Psychromonas sp.]